MTRPMPSLTFTTTACPAPEELLSWLPDPHRTLSWVRDGEGLVGWGEAARFTTRGNGRFARASRWWSRLTGRARVHNEVGGPGTGPVAFLSFAFADQPDDSVLVVPEVLVGRRGGIGWTTTVGAVQAPRRPVTAPRRVTYRRASLDDAGHRRAVAAAVARIRAGDADKVVLARDLMAVADAPLDERHLLTGLAEAFPTCCTFAVDGLVGATPELLLRREGRAVDAVPLAGTVWPRGGVHGDRLARELSTSAKNRIEHRYAARSVIESLRPLCSRLDAPSEPSVLRLPNVMHLATAIRGTLATDRSLLDLLARVHPTAAVGGWPTNAAVRLIEELEEMDRAGYLGPVGWLDHRGDGEAGIALRCARWTVRPRGCSPEAASSRTPTRQRKRRRSRRSSRRCGPHSGDSTSRYVTTPSRAT